MTRIFDAGSDPQSHRLPHRTPVLAATRALRSATARFFQSAEDFILARAMDDTGRGETATPPRFAVIAEASLGKTEAVLQTVARAIARGRRVLYLAPSISLGDDLAERARGIGIAEAHVIRGRSQENPDRPGETMCAKADIAEQIAALGYNVTETLCRDKAGNECEHAAGCAYLEQIKARRKGGALLIGAHAYLSIAMELLKEDKLDLLVIDESFWQAMVRSSAVAIDRFTTERGPNKDHRTYRPTKGEKMEDAGWRFFEDEDEFRAIHGKAIRAIETAQDARRPLTLADFREQQLSASDCRFAAGIEYTRLGAAEINPGMRHEEQREALKKAVQREAFSFARFWKLIGSELETARQGEPMSIRLVEGRVNRAGDLENSIVMDYSAEARFQRTPVLVIDADADPIILDRFYPGIQSETIAAEWSNVRIRQVTDRTGSKLAFSNPANRERVRLLAEDVSRQMRDRHAGRGATPGDSRPLVVVQKHIEDAWREQGHAFAYDGGDPCPEAPFHVAHFGNLRGKDGWKATTAAIIVGRIEPSPRELERLARAVFYKSETEIAELQADEKGKIALPRRSVRMEAKDGKTATVAVSFHPDDRADRILRQIREAELSQAIARVRPVHRGADQPCEILVLTSVPLRVQADSFATWDQVIPDRFRQMEMRGFAPDLACDVADAHPDLFSSSAAVRQAASRRAKCDDSYLNSFYGGCHTFEGGVRVEYRRKASRRGRQATVALRPGDTAETVAQRVREALPDAYAVVLLGPLPDPLEAAVAAYDAATDLLLYVEEIEARGEQIWWRPPLRSPARPATVPRPFQIATLRPPGDGLQARC